MKEFFGAMICIITGIIGYTINGNSIFWGVVDGLFCIIAWAKWLICHDVTLAIIKQSFAWFF